MATGCVKDLVEEEGERTGMLWWRMAVDDVGVAGLEKEEEEKTRLRNDQEEERALEGVNLRREVGGGEEGTGASDIFRFLEWR